MNTYQVQQGDFTFIYILDQDTLYQLGTKLKQINWSDLVTGGTYYVMQYSAITKEIQDPRTANANDIPADSLTNYYVDVNAPSGVAPSLDPNAPENTNQNKFDLNDVPTQILVALTLVGLLLGLIFGAWTLFFIALAIFIFYEFILSQFPALKNLVDSIKKFVSDAIPQVIKDALKNIPNLVWIFIFMLIIYLIYEAKKS